MRTLITGIAMATALTAATPTFTKDVAQIVNNRCVVCHRAGEAAPMAFTSYKEIRPWAKAIRDAVVNEKMPPWSADPAHGHFKNDRRLSPAEKDTLVQWAAAGAPEGEPAHLPPAPKFDDGWSIGKPDVVFDIGADFEVPASGTVPYKYFRVPTGFTEDRWVEAAEVRADKRGVVHHIIVFMLSPGEPQGRGEGGNMLIGFAPGARPIQFEPGTARLVKAGTVFNFQLHYTPNGTAVKDRSYVGLRFAKNPPVRQSIVGRAMNFAFKIPAMAPNHEVVSQFVARQEITLDGMAPHMHVRGKDFKYTAVFPDGRSEVLLNVPKYDFNWQLSYELAKPLTLPAGTRIECVAHFDNSPNNKYNPDPTKEVRWGDQTWEEMMIGFFHYSVAVNRPPTASSAGAGLE
ncbi:MAG: thiol-disulfide isomerase [Acidobacteria bacterium]|nr:thiol-disulfide isomerase [Acidobacteriota bacterium]